MILAFQSTQQAFGTFFAAGGALLICGAIFDCAWPIGTPRYGFSRWGGRIALVACGLGAIAMGYVTAIS